MRLLRTEPAVLPVRAAPIAVALGALGACAVLTVVDPNVPGRLPLCPFRLATGFDCPGCGSLRAMHALTRGDVVAAMDHNVVTVLLLVALVLVWPRWVRSGRLPLGGSAAPGYAIATGLALFWLVRNLPWAPWDRLASGLG